MAKERKKISNRFKNRFEGTTPSLPDNQEVNKALSKVIDIQPTTTTPKSSAKKGRPSLGKNRVKFTTMIDPKKRDQLKHIAINRGVSLADLLDSMIDKLIEEQ